MRADFERLGLGKNRTVEAAEYVAAARDGLHGGNLGGDMFGRTDAGQDAGSRMEKVHSDHRDGLSKHHEAVTAVSDHVASTSKTLSESDKSISSSIEQSGS